MASLVIGQVFVALAGVGAFLLAAVALISIYAVVSGEVRHPFLALVVMPLITMTPAFVVALVLASTLWKSAAPQ